MGKHAYSKNKGRKGQQQVQQLILQHFPQLEHDDCRSNPMGAGGEDILLSPAARKLIPCNIEVKWHAKIAACRFVEQAGNHGEYAPAAFFRENNSDWYVAITADYFFELLKSKENAIGHTVS